MLYHNSIYYDITRFACGELRIRTGSEAAARSDRSRFLRCRFSLLRTLKGWFSGPFPSLGKFTPQKSELDHRLDKKSQISVKKPAAPSLTEAMTRLLQELRSTSQRCKSAMEHATSAAQDAGCVSRRAPKGRFIKGRSNFKAPIYSRKPLMTQRKDYKQADSFIGMFARVFRRLGCLRIAGRRPGAPDSLRGSPVEVGTV